jgi:PAS domain S-box-containing protein
MKKRKGKPPKPNMPVKKSSSKTTKSKPQKSPVEKNTSSMLQSKKAGKRLQKSETEVVGVFAASEDITSRKRMEMALQENEEAFQTLAETMPQIVWATRADGWNIFFNKRWVEYTGLTLEESYGHGWNIPFHPDDQKRAWDAWQQATKHGATYSLEVRLRRADGVYRWWLVRGVPLLDTTGKIIKWFGTCTDIDDLKQAERRQTLSTEILGILNNPPAMDDAISKIITTLKRETGFDAIGIRLQRGDDFPYVAHDGFSKEFILAENTLAVRTHDGGVCVDKNGNISLECTCGMVISGKTDPTNPIFTPKGSCWTNESCSRVDLPIEDKRLHPRDRCIHEGFHSVALIPLRAGKRIIGILQLNDRRPNQFTLEMISFFEDMGSLIGIAVARKRAEDEMQKAKERADALNVQLEAANKELEERVAARTADLSRINEQLTQEVGERRRAEEAQRHTAEELQRLLDVVPAAVWVASDPQCLTITGNRWADQFYEARSGENVSATTLPDVRRFFDPNGRELASSELPMQVAAATNQVVRDVELHVHLPSGRRMTMLGSAIPLTDAKSNVRGCIGAFIDITDRKRAEEAQGHLAAIVESAEDAIISEDLNGIIQTWNVGADNVFGYKTKEVIGKPISILVPPGHTDEAPEILTRIIRGERIENFETERMRKNGTIIPVSLTFSAIKDASGRIIGASKIAHDITERKQAAEALLESERRLERAQEIAHLGSWELDLVNNRLSWSDEVYRIFGLQPQEFGATYEAFLDRVHPEDRAAVDAAYSGSLREGRDAYEIEHRVVRKSDGEVRIVHEKCEHFRNESGTIVRSIGMVHDITERKLAEEALRESEERLRLMGDNLPDSAVYQYVHESDGRVYFTYFSTGIERLNGVSAKDVMRDSGVLHRQIPPEYLTQLIEAEEQSAQDLSDFDMDVPMRRADGQLRWMRLHSRPRRMPNGQVVWDGVQTDITVRKQAEVALRESRERLDLALLSSRMATFDWDIVKNTRTWSDGVHSLLGTKPEAFTGAAEEFFQVIHPEDRSTVQAALAKAVEITGQYETEYRAVWPDGSIRYMAARGKIQRDSSGRAVVMTGVCWDITDRKTAEEQIKRLNDDLLERNEKLEFANKELESFIYSVSHDLRGPIRHIYGFSDLLRKSYADKLDEKGKRYFSHICSGTEKMSRLIDDLLNLSRISRQDIQREEVNLSTIAASIVAELREVHPDRNVEIDINEGLTAIADPGLIEVVLSNLLGNAWKFTGKTEHPRIEFGTQEQDGKIIYYVRDNGAGFDQQHDGKMFWPFHRLHSESAFEGTGIGLAIVDRVISRHGGKIWAEGAEGKGATIYFSLT